MLAIHLLQALLIAAVAALTAERVRTLMYVGPVGSAFLRELQRCAEAQRLDAALALTETMPDSAAARVARAGLQAGKAGGVEAMQEELLEARAGAMRRLRALRVCATLGSTVGLLGAIMALRGGFGGGGLLSLQAGLAERVALNQALLTMGIGVATSAVCFYGFGLLRRAALQVISQATQAARAVEAMVS